MVDASFRDVTRGEPERAGASEAPDDGRTRVFIEGVEPIVDAGAYAVKRVLGDTLTVSVDLLADGHDVIAGELLVSRPSTRELRGGGPARGDEEHPIHMRQRLEPLAGDRYSARIELSQLGAWHYSIEAWIDHFATWRRNLELKLQAAQDIDVDFLAGAALLHAALRALPLSTGASNADAVYLSAAAAALEDRSVSTANRARTALSPELSSIMARHGERPHASRYEKWLPVWVDRAKARFSSWYEMFPRSTGRGRHGTFETSLGMLPYIASMGFDVLYLPPIHPIGHTFRKGKNNAPGAAPGDVGSPWAIGGVDGGHKSVHPALGSLADFDRFYREAARQGLEIALDVALQVTPDHPYVKEHPEWFKRRPDGTIQNAENPPKKYQDL
jgi:starch synthase (maltosyl-transferring)